MKEYLSQWNAMRIIRLVLGVVIVIQGLSTNDYAIALLGGLFTLMPLLNVGCCGTNGCSTTPIQRKRNTTSGTEDISFEEVK